MADEHKEQEAEGKGGAPRLIRTIVPVGVMVLVPAILALAAFSFVLRPLLASDPAGGPEDPVRIIPESVVTYDLPEAIVSVVEEDPDAAAPVLTYQVSFVCADASTQAVVQARLSFFQSMLLDLHSARTQAELNDPYVRKTILKRAKQEANAILKSFDPGGSFEILEVLHVKYSVIPL